ncbi:MAG: dephospho-CoA kinase, partial [Myxococcota bacterium]
MKTIGLTGGIACGKSSVAALLRTSGVPVIDADQVSRQIVAPGQPALTEVRDTFGASVIS